MTEPQPPEPAAGMPPEGGRRRAVLREVALVYAGVCAATVAITRLGAVALADYVHLAVGALFLVTAVHLAQREEGGVERYGVAVGGLLLPPEEGARAGPFGLAELARTARRAVPIGLREAGFACALALAVFPPFALGFQVYYAPVHPFVPSLPEEASSFVLAQVLVVALPEEALFRGYFQTRLADAFPARRALLGARVSLPALVLQAALFAVVHFAVDLAPARLAVFFPGLLFGWVRAKRGGIGASLTLHALSNVFADVLVRGWL